jgi:hypothetical protein
LDRDGLLEPIAVDASLTDLLFVTPTSRSTPAPAAASAPEPAAAPLAVEQSALFELV